LFSVLVFKRNNEKLFSSVPLDEMLDRMRKGSEFNEEESILFEKLGSQTALKNKDTK